MNARILAIWILVAILGVSTPGQAQGLYSGGQGTHQEPYLIASAEDLWNLSNTQADWNGHFQLVADIDLGSLGPQALSIGYYASDQDNQPFSGTFDGAGHRITGLRLQHAAQRSLGLFGFVDGPNAVIENLVLVDPIVEAPQAIGVGALVGTLANGEVRRCGVDGGRVSGGQRVGGLVGLNQAIVRASFANCTVRGDKRVGGLVGACRGAALVHNAYSTGSVTAQAEAGGLLGFNEAAVLSCYTTAAVSAAESAGGLIAHNNGWVLRCVWDSERTGQVTSAAGTAQTSAALTRRETFEGWGASPMTWVLDDGVHPPTLAWQGLPGTFLQAPPLNDYLAGEGTAADPYQIESHNQFNWIGLYPDDWDKHFVLSRDIDLGLLDPNDLHPIGRFSGVFDGRGHAITGWVCRRSDLNTIGLFRWVSGRLTGITLTDPLVDSRPQGAQVGTLVGTLQGGSLEDCQALGGQVYGRFNVGGLAGQVLAGTVRHCAAVTFIEGSSQCGGLLGYNNGTVLDCTADGQVTRGADIGGLVGVNHSDAVVFRSCAYADLLGNNRIGGLVGSNYGILRDVYATGQVQGAYSIGGLAGANYGSIRNAYSSNRVDGGEYVGGLVGEDQSGTVEACFYNVSLNGPLTGLGAAAGPVQDPPDVTGAPQASLQRAVTFLSKGWDFVDETLNGTDDIWRIQEGLDTPRFSWEPLVPIAQVIVTVSPEILSRSSGTDNVLLFIHRPDQVRLTPPVRLYIGQTALTPFHVTDSGRLTLAFFRKADLLEALEDGEQSVLVRMTSSEGATLIGTDTIEVTRGRGPSAHDILTWQVAYEQIYR